MLGQVSRTPRAPQPPDRLGAPRERLRLVLSSHDLG
jgi:hypothetical protein